MNIMPFNTLLHMESTIPARGELYTCTLRALYLHVESPIFGDTLFTSPNMKMEMENSWNAFLDPSLQIWRWSKKERMVRDALRTLKYFPSIESD